MTVMIKAILWDNDGILVDTERLYFLATRQVLAAIGINLTQEIYVEFFLNQGKGAWHLAEERGIAPEEIARLRNERDARYSRLLCEEALVIDGVETTLNALSRKYVMGIVTSSQRDHFELIHQSTGLLKYFDFVITSDNYTRFKPDPEPYLVAVERTGFGKDECLAVEDSERGLASATGAGVKCLVIPHELTRVCSFTGAYKILNNVREVASELL